MEQNNSETPTEPNGSTNGAAGNVNNSAALQMFAQPTPAGEQNNGDMPIDLDDLFHDCYFGDFPVPPFSGAQDGNVVPDFMSSSAVAAAATTATTTTTTTNPPTTTVPNTTITAPTVATVVAPTTVPVQQQQQPQQQQIVTTQKRKADTITPSPVSTTTTYSTTSQFPSYSSAPAPARKLTEQQKVERRNRNREHAKRSRLRKKFLLESLQEQIHGLQSEISSLKDIIKKELPEKADALLEVYGAKEKYTPLPMPSGFGPVKTLMEPDYRLMSALSGSQQNFSISDPSLPDNPIVYVSQGFLDLTGYSLDQVLGRNCRFLQGPGTDQSAVDVIRKGVREGVDTSVCLLNYKADGTPFWNQFFVAALRDAENNVVNFVGVQCEVSKAVVESHMSNSISETGAASTQPKVEPSA
eukprot:CAMPEP_0178955660 /NCGR_PEP_ID=MMETSP0789-20121207/9742_1 /TAXON_ID=3005 /ORGANISM="Rhizosolenia setigera, Strain CCMP 1694" /LENGTH=411 /DNA_ID=CAMNT_0020637343 /DNA_START=24 /DNA_END=1259 /DNA_ORIENTATION=-